LKFLKVHAQCEAADYLLGTKSEDVRMPSPWPRWRIVSGTLACCLGAAAAGYAQFTSFNDRSRAMLEGNWQSCRESDGQYSERVYDAKLPGIGPFELHMGPDHEFALFRGIQDDHRDHHSPDNLLKPFTVELVNSSARQKWDVAGLHLEVSLAGGSREDCESWFVTLKRIDSTSSSSSSR
jgi:hypothetical protein